MNLLRLVFIFTVAMIFGADLALAVQTAHPLGFVEPNGPIAEMVITKYNLIFWICLAVYVLVQGVILWCIFAYRRSSKRTLKDAKKFSHSTTLEVIWTTIPVIICAYIGWHAWLGIQFIRTVPEDALPVDVIAYQFSWKFDYPELGISAPEAGAPDAELTTQESNPRYVKEFVVPVGRDVVLNITAQDVIHAVYIPAFGIKIDAIPGRINYQWFRADKPGSFIGQCAELCGSAHGEMFFRVKVVEEAEWQTWVNGRRRDAGLEPLTVAQLAAPVAAEQQ